MVEVSEDALEVRFGPWRLSTPMANVADTAVTGPYAVWKTAPRSPGGHRPRSTFATNGIRGVRISFHEPVRGIDPWGVIKHPELTVTVANVDALANLMSAV